MFAPRMGAARVVARLGARFVAPVAARGAAPALLLLVALGGCTDPGGGLVDDGGRLRVTTTTELLPGAEPPDGFRVLVEGRSAQDIGLLDTVFFSNVPPGEVEVELTELGETCSAADSPRAVVVEPRELIGVPFAVTCGEEP